jgi:hypothetical protein
MNNITNRRDMLKMLAGSAGAAALGAVALPTANAAVNAPLPAYVDPDKIAIAIQALVIAEESIEEMRRSPRPDKDSIGRQTLMLMSCSVANQLALLRRACPTVNADAQTYPDVEKVRNHRHRYRRNQRGQERAVLAMRLVTESLDDLIDAYTAPTLDELAEILHGVFYDSYSTESLLDSCTCGRLTTPIPDPEPPLGVYPWPDLL